MDVADKNQQLETKHCAEQCVRCGGSTPYSFVDVVILWFCLESIVEQKRARDWRGAIVCDD